jgi:hypothetical protein
MWPQEEIERLCQQCGVTERQRKLNLGMLVRAASMTAGICRSTSPGGATACWLTSPMPVRTGSGPTALGAYGLEVSGTTTDDVETRHRVKVRQLRDHPYGVDGYVVVVGFATHNVIFSFNRFEEGI